MHSAQKALILILLLRAAGSQTYTVTQQFHTNSFSDDDIVSTPNPWTLSGANIPPYRFFTDCAGTRLLGGYKVLSGDNTNPAFLQKSWTNLPPHFAMTISMKIYKIDSWSTDSFFIMVDGVSSQIYTWGSTTGASDICGQPNPLINSFNPQYNEYVQSYSQTIAHSSPTLTIKLISSLKSWTGSWGIRQLSIKLSRCHLSCLTCTNASVCAACDNTNGLTTVGQFCQCSASGVRKLIMTNCPITNCVSCVAACPSGYFNATSCASCNTACATCIGPGSLLPDCTSCNPQGYIDPGTSVCTVCYGTCASCTGILLNQCTSCQYGSFLNANRCLTSCPTGTYGLQSSKTCVPCNSPCATCDGSSVNHCLSCVATFFLYQTTCSNPCPFSMYGYNGLCVSSCPLGTYPDTTSTPLCINCPAFCQTCDQTGLCITCVSGAYFSPYDNLCHNPCLGSYYGDNQTFVCAACDPSCLTCHGPTSGQCNSCPPLTYLVYSTCYSTCPPHTYSLTCILCHSSCLNCSGPSSTECTSCNKLQMFHLNKSQCVDSCYDGDISNNAEMTCITCPTGETGYFKKCVPCFATCNTCNGIWYTDCQSCVNKSSSTGLMFDFSKKLDNKTIVYHTSSKTCIYEDTGIVYMPSTTNTDGKMYTALLFMIWANIGLTILLQFLFKYKTNLLLTLEAMQLFSYLYYFSSPLSESNQILLLTLYNSHPTYLLSAHNIVPSATQLLSLSATTQKLFPKASILSKTGIFIIDTFYFHIVMLIIIILFVIIRISCKDWPLYNKSNPYLITYSFRLLFTQFLFAALLFISYGGLSDDLSKAGLAILVLDCVLLACSLFWKVRTEQQIQHAHYALFYFNQLGPKTGQYKQLNHQKSLQRTMNQQDEKVQKQVNLESQVISKKPSILPSLLHYLSRIPIVLTLTLFTNQPITQSICLLIYSIFLLGINLVLQYRRRIYRFMTLSVYFAFVICAMFLVLMCCNLSVWIGFDFIIVALFAGLLLCTVGQLLGNLQFLESVLAYFWAKFCGRSSN